MCWWKQKCQTLTPSSSSTSAGWKGWGCTDGSTAQSYTRQLTATMLLTLSNLFFLPAIVVAIRRSYITEAFVYLFTMSFSTVSTAAIKRERTNLFRLKLQSFWESFLTTKDTWTHYTRTLRSHLVLRYWTSMLLNQLWTCWRQFLRIAAANDYFSNPLFWWLID